MALSGWSIKHKTKGDEVTQTEYESANSHDVDAAPEGDTGVQGDTGTQGDTGAATTGDTGTASTVAGDTGTQGDTGVQGDTGADSTVQGDTGPGGGDQGDTGVQGDTGIQGDTGAQGDTGVQGDTGAASTVAGDTGAQGDTGTQGDTGAASTVAGDTGAQGDTGTQGDTGVTATKEFFIPCHHGTNATEFYLGWVIAGAGERCHIHFMVPQDFTTISNAEVIIQAAATNASMDFTITIWYGAEGEAYNTHSESATPSVATTTGALHAIDISSELSSLATGDHVIVRVAYLNDTNAYIKGIRLKYT